MSPKKETNNFFLLRLFVAGESENSLRAISNLNDIAEEFSADSRKVEIVNVLDEKTYVIEEGVLVTPTLVMKNGSLPPRQIIGDLSDRPKVLSALRAAGLANGAKHKKTVPLPKVQPSEKLRRSK